MLCSREHSSPLRQLLVNGFEVIRTAGHDTPVTGLHRRSECIILMPPNAKKSLAAAQIGIDHCPLNQRRSSFATTSTATGGTLMTSQTGRSRLSIAKGLMLMAVLLVRMLA